MVGSQVLTPGPSAVISVRQQTPSQITCQEAERERGGTCAIAVQLSKKTLYPDKAAFDGCSHAK